MSVVDWLAKERGSDGLKAQLSNFVSSRGLTGLAVMVAYTKDDAFTRELILFSPSVPLFEKMKQHLVQGLSDPPLDLVEIPELQGNDIAAYTQRVLSASRKQLQPILTQLL